MVDLFPRERNGRDELAAQLLESQERYRTLFQTLPQGVIYYAADGLIMEANPAAREILGIDMEKILTWPLPTASRAVHEDGTPFQPDELPIKVALRTGEVVVDVVMGVQHGRTDEQRWLRITAVPDARGAGYNSTPSPVVICTGVPPLDGTAQMWRRSISLALVQ